MLGCIFEDKRSPGARVYGGYELPSVGAGKVTLQEQSVRLTNESSLQPVGFELLLSYLSPVLLFHACASVFFFVYMPNKRLFIEEF